MTLISTSKRISLVVGNIQWVVGVGDVNKSVSSQPQITQKITEIEM